MKLTIKERWGVKNKTVVITGASRGVGREIALRAARDGAHVVILAKTAERHQILPGTINSVRDEIVAAGGSALALKVDVRFEDQVGGAISYAAAIFGGIDAIINNASALPFDGSPKQLQLVHDVIVNGTRFCTEACLPYLQKSDNPHVINIAPPLPMTEHWIEKYGAYALAKRTISKYTDVMSEMYPGIAFSTLWPKKMLFTSATILGVFKSEEKARKHTRDPKIMAEAMKFLLESERYEKIFWTDEQVLAELGGVTDFSCYLMSGSKEEDLMPDIFV